MLETDIRKTFEHNWNFDKDHTTISGEKGKILVIPVSLQIFLAYVALS